MAECPKCEDTEKIHYIARFLTTYDIEIQCICRHCGNIFREKFDKHGW